MILERDLNTRTHNTTRASYICIKFKVPVHRHAAQLILAHNFPTWFQNIYNNQLLQLVKGKIKCDVAGKIFPRETNKIILTLLQMFHSTVYMV